MNWLSNVLSDVGEMVSSTNYWFGIFTSFALVFVHHRIKLPKLVVSGGGASSRVLEGGEMFGTHRLTLENSPKFFGYSINREALSVSSARIYDPEKKVYEGHVMRWQGAPENKPFNTEIKAGQSAQLFVCGVYKQRVHHYAGETLHNINLSETLVELGKSRKLEIHVQDSLQRRYKIPFKISVEERRNHTQKVHISISVKTTFSDRLRQFTNGFYSMLGAFTRPSY